MKIEEWREVVSALQFSHLVSICFSSDLLKNRGGGIFIKFGREFLNNIHLLFWKIFVWLIWCFIVYSHIWQVVSRPIGSLFNFNREIGAKKKNFIITRCFQVRRSLYSRYSLPKVVSRYHAAESEKSCRCPLFIKIHFCVLTIRL